jgi:hypothetical protein
MVINRSDGMEIASIRVHASQINRAKPLKILNTGLA